jgi:ComF family protein
MAGRHTFFGMALSTRRAVQEVLDWLYPSGCALCGASLQPAVCDECRAELPFHPEPFRRQAPGGSIDYVQTRYRFSGRAAQMVKRLKYQRLTALSRELASEMLEVFLQMEEPDLVLPMPIHWSRRFERGFNQADVLSEKLPRVRTDVCQRVRRTPPQASLPPEERGLRLQGAFRCSDEVKGKHVLLVDDVITSGHTAEACAPSVREAGADRVGLLTLCSSH